jgi:hypothetical protein
MSVLEDILSDLLPAAEQLSRRTRRRRRVARATAAGAGAMATLTSGAIAVGVLGSPAPPSVVRDLQDVDRGMPADLRHAVDVSRARAAAVSGDSVVYFAPRAGGGYCAELVTHGRARGAVCSGDTAAITVTVPFTDPVKPTSPVTVSGRVASASADQVQLVYPDGGSDTVEVSPDRFYVADVPERHLPAVHAHGLLLVARAGDGREVAKAVVHEDAITPQADRTPADPIETDLLSDGSDLTKLLGVRGRINADGVTRLELTYPDGTVTRVPLHGRRYRIDFPPARRDDFARASGSIAAYSASGRKVARRAVYSVAGWQRAHGG